MRAELLQYDVHEFSPDVPLCFLMRLSCAVPDGFSCIVDCPGPEIHDLLCYVPENKASHIDNPSVVVG